MGQSFLIFLILTVSDSNGSQEASRYDSWLKLKQVSAELAQVDQTLQEKQEANIIHYPVGFLAAGLLLTGYLHETELIGDHYFWRTVFISVISGFAFGVLKDSGGRSLFRKLSALKSARSIYNGWLPINDSNSELVIEAANLMVQLSIWIDSKKMNTSFERWHFLRTANAFIFFVSKLETLELSDEKINFLKEAVGQVFGAVKIILDKAHEQKDFPLARKAVATRNRILGFMGSSARMSSFRKFTNLAGEAGVSVDDLSDYSDEWDKDLQASISHYTYVSKVDPSIPRPTLKKISVRDETVIQIITPTKLLPEEPVELKRLVLAGKIEEKFGAGVWVRFPNLSTDLWSFFKPEDSIPKVEGLVDLANEVEGTLLYSRHIQVFWNAFPTFGDIGAVRAISRFPREARDQYPWLERCFPTLAKLWKKI